MEEIIKYLMTILGVFICLWAIFVLIILLKIFSNKKKNRFESKIGIRSNFEDNKDNLAKIKNSKIINNIEEIRYNNEKIYKFDNGDRYKGDIIDGKKNGFGICLFQNNDRYEGLWKNDQNA